MGRIRRTVEKNLLGSPVTAEYRPSRPLTLGTWFGAQGYGPFTLSITDEMRHDPVVRMSMKQSDAPLYLSEFEYECGNPAVLKFIQETLEDIWKKGLDTILECVPYGYACAEAMYKDEGGLIKFDSLKHLHPRDTVPFTYKGRLAYALIGSALMTSTNDWNRLEGEDTKKVTEYGGVKLRASRESLPAKALWSVHEGQYNQWYGMSAMMPVWWPWRLKTMPDGALENLAKYAYKHAYSGMIARAPDEYFQDNLGQVPLYALDFMRQLGEQMKTGANVALPNRLDASQKNYAFTIEQISKIEGSMTALLDWPDWLDRMITKGFDIPDEIINHQGNGLPLAAPVLTPTGWKAIGDLKVGDAIIDPEGSDSVVKRVYPQGVRPVYKFTFADGSTVVADENHRWKLHKHHSKGECVVLTTKEIIAEMNPAEHPVERPTGDTVCPGCGSNRVGFLEKRKAFQCKVKGCRKQFTNFGWHRRRKRSKGNLFFLPQHDPVIVETCGKLLIDPYLVGLLIGNGGLTHDNVRFTSPDEELVDSLRRLVPEGATVRQEKCDEISYSVNNAKIPGGRKFSLKRKVVALGMDKLSYEKSIPEAYLWASVADRISLLQGLMDTDGSADKSGYCEYCTTSKKLAEQVQYLVQSLGGKVTISTKLLEAGRVVKNKRTGKINKPIATTRLAYVLKNIRFPLDNDINPFRLKRKHDRYAARIRQRIKNGWGIKSIEPCGEEETVCISVSAPSALYFTEHFIPTHNTGGFSRSQVAYSAYFIGRESRRNRILESVDVQIIRPLVNLNFGETEYKIKGKPIRPPEQGQQQPSPQPGQEQAQPGQEQQQEPDLLTGNSDQQQVPAAQMSLNRLSSQPNRRLSHEMTPRREKALRTLAKIFLNGAARSAR